jgi:hypothetical protein
MQHDTKVDEAMNSAGKDSKLGGMTDTTRLGLALTRTLCGDTPAEQQ